MLGKAIVCLNIFFRNRMTDIHLVESEEYLAHLSLSFFHAAMSKNALQSYFVSFYTILITLRLSISSI